MTQPVKKQKDWDVLNIIRYGILAVLIIYIGILLSVNRGSNASFSSVSTAVEKAADISKMTKGTDRDLKRYYGLNAKDFEEVSFYYTNETMGVEELLLIKVDSESNASAVEEAMKTRQETQIDNFKGYGAEQVKLLESSVQKTKGKFLLFVVSPNAAKFEKAFKKSL